jgi:hypothetical protein
MYLFIYEYLCHFIRFQGHLYKYTNAFKGYQSRYCVLDAPTKSLLYFMVYR